MITDPEFQKAMSADIRTELVKKSRGLAETYIRNLDEAILFHQQNQNDPHNISNAVICSLTEVRNAFAQAHGFPERVE